jgi:DNA polymerase-3 subunit delta
MARTGEPLGKVLGLLVKQKVPAILVTRFDADAGEDLFGRDRLVAEIERAVLGGSSELFGRTVIDAPAISLAEVLAAAREVSLLTPKRLVLVRGSKLAAGSETAQDDSVPPPGDTEAGLAAEKSREKGGDDAQLAVLDRYLKEVSKDACIAFIGCAWDARRRIHKGLLEAATVVDLSRPDPREIPGWIGDRVREGGGTIEPGAVNALAELRGNDTMRLSSEIEKLLIHAGPSAKISREAVFALVGAGEAASAWALVDAMADGDALGAVRILRGLLDEGEAAPAIVGAIASRLRQLVVLRDEKTVGRPNEAARRVVFPGRSIFFADAVARKAARFTPEALLAAMASLYEVDKRSKSSSLDAGALLEEWLLSALKSASFVRS